MTASELGRRLIAGQWLLPRAAERRLGRVGERGALLSLGDVEYPSEPEPRWTPVGSVGGRGFGIVDPAGLFTPTPHGWSLDWWIGADDRWHLPAREPSLRQELFEGVPIVETRMRIPSGDAIHRVYGVGGPGDLAVIEIENASPAPVAVALSIRPCNPLGPRPVEHIEVAGAVVSVDGDVGLVLPRPAQRVAPGTADSGDSLRPVTGGDAVEDTVLVVSDHAGAGSASVVVPLAHRATLRFAVPMAGGLGDASSVMDRLPPRDAVVRGWEAQLGRGMRVEVPDEPLMRAVDACRAWLLLADDGVEPVATPWSGSDLDAGALVVAESIAWRLGPHTEEVAGSLPRRLRRRLRQQDDAAPTGPAATRVVDDLLREATATFTWGGVGEGHRADTSARFLQAVRGMLVRRSGDDVVIFEGLPEAWRGAPVEIHDAPVGSARLSAAVRWHSDKPAVLWDVDDDVTLVAPTLDAEWRATERAGEALLGAAPHRPGPA